MVRMLHNHAQLACDIEYLRNLFCIAEAGGTESTAEDSMQSMREQQAELAK